MRYFADYIKGKPYQRTVLWENSSPTSTFASQTVILSDDVTNYDEIEVIYKAGISDTDTKYVKVSVDNFLKPMSGSFKQFGFYGAYNGASWCRIANYDSDTSIRFGDGCGVKGSNTNSSAVIPLKIIGIKKGLGEVNPPEAEKFTFSIGTTETVITLPHAPKSIVALYNTSSSFPKAGTCMYDVVNETFLKSSGTGVWTKFEVDGDKLTLLGDNSTSNWTYDCIVV